MSAPNGQLPQFPAPAIRVSLLFVLLSAVLVSGCDDILGPRSFDDCILKNMRGVTNNAAAALISRSCRQKFPEARERIPKSRDLKPSETAAITGRAGLSFGTTYGGDLSSGSTGLDRKSAFVKC